MVDYIPCEAESLVLERKESLVDGGIRREKLADAIVAHIESRILEGSLRAGERLLPERDLAQKLNVSRPSLREALEILAQRHILISRRGGTLVAPVLGADFGVRLSNPADNQHGALYDYLEFRSVVEGSATYFAALRASDIDRDLIARRFHDVEAANRDGDPLCEAEADSAFHLAIYEASHNVILLHIMSSLGAVFRESILHNREKLYQFKGVRAMLLEQHRNIHNAILSGDADAARGIAEAHVDFTRRAMHEIDLADQRLEYSLRSIFSGADDRTCQDEDEESSGATNDGVPSHGQPKNEEESGEVPLLRLLRSHPETAFDYLEFRHVAEGMSAYRAACLATKEDRRRIEAAFSVLLDADKGQDPAIECRADRDFHLALYLAAHNDVMAHTMRRILLLQHQDAFYDRSDFRGQEGVRGLLMRQHKALFEAVMRGDGDEARAAAERHMLYIRDRLIESRIAEQRLAVARRRVGRSDLVQQSSRH
ncbi:MAG: FCD domain-containing protein [Rhodospirillaceae bacterium]|nr:FCD domain-containing protein [Rhodospirillaceae bacterium]